MPRVRVVALTTFCHEVKSSSEVEQSINVLIAVFWWSTDELSHQHAAFGYPPLCLWPGGQHNHSFRRSKRFRDCQLLDEQKVVTGLTCYAAMYPLKEEL
jgi:hypothetical protein